MLCCLARGTGFQPERERSKQRKIGQVGKPVPRINTSSSTLRREIMTTENSAAPNAQRLLWAGFMAILAAGVGFAIRGGILTQWADKYGFTMTELGQITGGGLFAFGIII